MKIFSLLLMTVLGKLSFGAPLHTFSTGDLISSSKVNANFSQADARLNVLEARPIVKFVSVTSPVTNQALSVPPGASVMVIEGVGGGGGGGGGNCSTGNGMGGIGGTAYFGKAVVPISDTDTIVVSTGAGGSGGIAPSTCATSAGNGSPGSATEVKKNGTAIFHAAGGTDGSGSTVSSCVGGPPPSPASGTPGSDGFVTGALIQFAVYGRGHGGMGGTGCGNNGLSGENGFVNIWFH